MRRGRRVIAAITVAVAAAGLAACGSPETEARDELEAALRRTEPLSRQFEYKETTIIDGVERVVQGIVEDDLRYRARLTIDGEPVLDEVAYDDTLAVRVFEPQALGNLLRKEAHPSREALQAITSGQWLVDESGAPGLFRESGTERELLGDDPILDARTTFDYVRSVARQLPVRRFNPDALDYKPKEDPFPKPEEDSDVTRYDFMRFPVPRPSESGSGNQAVPTEVNFRKMAVYVKDGIVIRILEQMDVASRLDDIERNYELQLEGSTRERIKTAIDAINVVRRGQGVTDPIRVRHMDLRLTEIGEENTVELPGGTTVAADLSFLRNRGGGEQAGENQPAA